MGHRPAGGGAAVGGDLRALTIRCAPRRVHRAVLSHPLTAPRHRNRLERGEKKAPADRSAGAPGEKQEDRTSRSAQARKREISMPRVSMTVKERKSTRLNSSHSCATRMHSSL